MLGTSEEVPFFSPTYHQLLLELTSVISTVFQNSEDGGKEMEQTC